MKADKTLAERTRLEAEDQRELRAALVCRHAQTADEGYALEAPQVAMDVNSPAYRAMAARLRD